MSIVGPRPALFNQSDLIAMRTKCQVSCLIPGITGFAQVKGRDHLDLPSKVRFDALYLHASSFKTDLELIFETIKQIIRPRGIMH